MPPAEPWNIVAQQGLVLVLERGEIPTMEMVQLLHGSFPELPRNDIALLVEHLVQKGFLDRAQGVVRVGPEAERVYARGNYRDLLASFSGTMLLTGRHGASEVGYIDPTVLTGEKDNRLLLLAGRSWRVTEVDWSKRVVWLEPAAEGGKARWMGGARSLGRDVCQAIRQVLATGAPSFVQLSNRAKSALQGLIEELPISPGTHFVVTRSDAGLARTWTFAGTKANRAMAHLASVGGQKVRFDALSVNAPAAALIDELRAPLTLTGAEIGPFAESVKFFECVPMELLKRTIATRNFEDLSSAGTVHHL